MNISLCRERYFMDGTVYPPMGLLTLAPYFDKKHTLFWRDKQIMPVGGDGKIFYPDICLISAFSSQLNFIERDIKDAKVNFGAKSKFIVGGPAVTSNPEYAAKVCPSADLLFAGDGEYLAENIETCLADGKRIVDYRQYPYPLEDKKLPAWASLDYFAEYNLNNVGFGVETSRGCPYNCVMCTAHMIHSRRWRGRKPEDVVNELVVLKERFGAKKVYFTDDNATANPSRWVELMQQIADKNLGLTLSVPEGIQAHHLDRETLLVMKAAGLTHFTIGAESGNQRVLDSVVNKGGLTVEKIEDTVRLANSLGMRASCFFVIGFIGETFEEAAQTVRFAEKLRRLGAETCTVRNAIPMPGTQLFEIAKREDCLVVPEEQLFNFNYVHNGKHLLRTKDWLPEQIEQLVNVARVQGDRHFLRCNPLVFVEHPRASLRLLKSCL